MINNFIGFFEIDFPEINKSIDEFQIIKNNDDVIFRLVVNNNYSSAVSDFIKSYWEKEMMCKVNIEIVDFIPLTKSGKKLLILNNI